MVTVRIDFIVFLSVKGSVFPPCSLWQFERCFTTEIRPEKKKITAHN